MVKIKFFEFGQLLLPSVFVPLNTLNMQVLLSVHNKIAPLHVATIHLALYMIIIVVLMLQRVKTCPPLSIFSQTEIFILPGFPNGPLLRGIRVFVFN